LISHIRHAHCLGLPPAPPRPLFGVPRDRKGVCGVDHYPPTKVSSELGIERQVPSSSATHRWRAISAATKLSPHSRSKLVQGVYVTQSSSFPRQGQWNSAEMKPSFWKPFPELHLPSHRDAGMIPPACFQNLASHDV